MRIASILEYDGSGFSGWQRQDHARSVQAAVEEAFARVADGPIEVTAAGRTDAGVHACAQVVHFDAAAERPDHAWQRGAVSHLPPDVVVLWAGVVDAAFHARYSATGRRYRYVIHNRPARPSLFARQVTHEYRSLDVNRMREAAAMLVGRHDFSSFRSSECQAKHAVRDLRGLEVNRRGEFVVIDAHADAFLHHMVRNLAGVLMSIGAGEKEPAWARAVLRARDRRRGGVTAPPAGLYLTGIEYPEHYNIPVVTSGRFPW